jgi:hypothetical protein
MSKPIDTNISKINRKLSRKEELKSPPIFKSAIEHDKVKIHLEIDFIKKFP